MDKNNYKIVLVDECVPINTRNTKILDSLALSFPNAEIHVISWDRENKYHKDSSNWEYHLFTRPAIYGNKIQKLSGLFGYRKFCCTEIRKINPDIVIASHWNNLLMLPSLSKRQMLIYENLDAPTGPFMGRKILNAIEHFYMNKAALTIHASRFYTDLYPQKYPQLVLENKPTINTQSVNYSPERPLRIVYLGNIRYIDILKNLADAVKDNKNIIVYYHGSGPDYQQLIDYTQKMSNIVCTGAYKYEDIEKIYSNADVIWAAYPNKDFNVKYAISNKFHESMAYGIPAIFSDNTKLGDYANLSKIGFEVDPYSVIDIQTLIDSLLSDKDKLKNAHIQLKSEYLKETSWNQDFVSIVQHINKFFL